MALEALIGREAHPPQNKGQEHLGRLCAWIGYPLSRLDAIDISPIGESPSVVDVSRGFEDAADLIVRIASKEIRLVRLGEVIRADTRKINAISEVMLPSMDRSIKEIARVLEEHEREEIFRLKRTKGRREASVV
jgi:vacuolar-type H+-ATPase subunit D/Vma8